MNVHALTQQHKTTIPMFTPVRSNVLQRKCACGDTLGPIGECAACRRQRLLGGTMQPKLTINQPGDKYEQEADRVAEQVMRLPEPRLQRQAEDEEEDDELLQTRPLVQRKATAQSSDDAAPGIVHQALRSPGQPLDSAMRAFMEPRFGHDFSRVRVHTDAQAAESAQAVRARAYTLGRNIVFGVGQYVPCSMHGRHLIAHELAHTVQQGSGQVLPPSTINASSRNGRREVKASKGGASSYADVDSAKIETGSLQAQMRLADQKIQRRSMSCGSTPSRQDLGPTNKLNRRGRLRRRPKLCKEQFNNLELALDESAPGLHGINKGSIQVSAPEGLVAGLTGCSPECLVFRQFVKVKSFENGIRTPAPLESCNMVIAASGLGTTFFEEQADCFVTSTPGQGKLSWHDGPGRTWNDSSTEPNLARWEFTARVMIWDSCLGEPKQTMEGRLTLLKNGAEKSAEVVPYRRVSNDFQFISPTAKC